MQQTIGSIVSGFTRIPDEQLKAATVIDRNVIGNSIMVHRMYAKLAEEGYNVDAYWEIQTYGDLLARQEPEQTAGVSTAPIRHDSVTSGNNKVAVGIDAEDIAGFPAVADYREDPFYTMNFSPGEIAYCILQPIAAASFAGLFAAKEAIVKAAPEHGRKPFNSIIIDHLTSGKPVHHGFEISISHTDQFAIAVAVYIPSEPGQLVAGEAVESVAVPGKTAQTMLLILSLLLSIAALIASLRAIFD